MIISIEIEFKNLRRRLNKSPRDALGGSRIHVLRPKSFEKVSRLVVLCDFTHAVQGFFTGIAAITQT